MGTTTIGSQATQLSACPTFQGSIAIATDAPSTIDFGGLGSIDGDLIADTALNVNTLTANSVKNITGQFKMNNMSALLNLEMQQLRGVGQIGKPNTGINWQGLPILQNFDFGRGLDSASSIDIENTQLQDLSPINVKVANMVQISNNNQLSKLDWGMTNCTNLTISGNGATTSGINVTLASLQGVASLTVRNASALALPNIETCDSLFNVEAALFDRLDLPKLSQVGAISIANSGSLTEVSMPALQQCSGGALKLTNNDQLGGQISFPQLTQIRGELNITGSFTGVDMPKLNTIQGTSYLWSTEDIGSTCSLFGPQGTGRYAGNKIQGKPIVCQSNKNSASAAGGGDSRTGSSDSSQSSGAAIANFVASPASLFGASGLFAAMLGLM